MPPTSSYKTVQSHNHSHNSPARSPQRTISMASTLEAANRLSLSNPTQPKADPNILKRGGTEDNLSVPVLIYCKYTQRCLCLLHGKRRLLKNSEPTGGSAAPPPPLESVTAMDGPDPCLSLGPPPPQKTPHRCAGGQIYSRISTRLHKSVNCIDQPFRRTAEQLTMTKM